MLTAVKSLLGLAALPTGLGLALAGAQTCYAKSDGTDTLASVTLAGTTGNTGITGGVRNTQFRGISASWDKTEKSKPSHCQEFGMVRSKHQSFSSLHDTPYR